MCVCVSLQLFLFLACLHVFRDSHLCVQLVAMLLVCMCLWQCVFMYMSMGMLLFLSTHLGDVPLCVYTFWGCFFVCKYVSSCIHIFADFILCVHKFFADVPLCVHVLRITSLLVCTCLLGCLCACQVSCTGEHVSVGHIRVFP